MADTQPTILVKKADGTSERITLAELKARQSKPVVAAVVQTVPAPVSVPAVSPTPSPVIEPPRGLVIGPAEKKNQPVSAELAQDKIVQTPLKPEDLKPLHHEEVPESPHADMTVSSDRTDQVSKIITSLSFKIPAQFENRLRSSIQLRLKDIRSEADTLDLCLRSIKDGGLGMTQSQADEIISKTQPNSKPVIQKNISSGAPVMPPMPVVNTMKKTEREAAVDKIIGQVSTSPAISDLIIPKKSEAITPGPIRSGISMSTKLMVHDVQSKPVTMGPLDEILYFSLIDLRRLSSVPSEAVSRLKQKFLNLKEESFLLFMDSWGAWRNSPLYKSYLEIVDNALSQKFSLNAALDSKDKISLAEIEAIMKMEKELDM